MDEEFIVIILARLIFAIVHIKDTKTLSSQERIKVKWSLM